jgi:hypothetical protein
LRFRLLLIPSDFSGIPWIGSSDRDLLSAWNTS